jgi:hypothetical protein
VPKDKQTKKGVRHDSLDHTYHIETIERWSVHVFYTVKAASSFDALRAVNGNSAEPLDHKFVLGETDTIDEILSVERDD